MRYPYWLLFAAAAAITVLVAIFVVVWREPIPAQQGTAPSVITGTAGSEAQPLSGSTAQQDPRQVPSGTSAARAERGSGVEGVTSGGTTLDPPSK